MCGFDFEYKDQIGFNEFFEDIAQNRYFLHAVLIELILSDFRQCHRFYVSIGIDTSVYAFDIRGFFKCRIVHEHDFFICRQVHVKFDMGDIRFRSIQKTGNRILVFRLRRPPVPDDERCSRCGTFGIRFEDVVSLGEIFRDDSVSPAVDCLIIID